MTNAKLKKLAFASVHGADHEQLNEILLLAITGGAEYDAFMKFMEHYEQEDKKFAGISEIYS